MKQRRRHRRPNGSGCLVWKGEGRNYRGWWSHLERFLSSKGCMNLSDVTGEMAEEYLRDLSDSVVLVSYNNRLTLFKSMWRMLSERGRNVREETWERFSMKEGGVEGERP